jgi:hypothetical protein
LEKKTVNIEELIDDRWITDAVFLVDVTGHLNNPNEELQHKNKLTTNMYDNIRPWKSSFDCGKPN